MDGSWEFPSAVVPCSDSAVGGLTVLGRELTLEQALLTLESLDELLTCRQDQHPKMRWYL